jgi:hypothetical protein
MVLGSRHPPHSAGGISPWIETAKREDTKLRRLKEAIPLLVGGKVLGLE